VLNLFSVIIAKLNVFVAKHIPDILQYILKSTLSLITHDFNSYIDIRVNFFGFLQAVINNCFEVLMASSTQEQFSTVVKCIIFTFEHEKQEISEVGLDVLEVTLSVPTSTNNAPEMLNRNENRKLILLGFLHGYYWISAEDSGRRIAHRRP
jgi:hypothetical protein